MPKPLDKVNRYMAGLDGFRALAVFAVIIYHLNSNWAPGGLIGVGIFFVLSGYLITDILVAQWEDKGKFDLKNFWLRRARRLLPAMILMLFVVVIWALLFQSIHLYSLRGDVPAALLYISNWWLVFHEVSYFDSFGPASPLGHLWSLAVEEQFYLLWPLVLMLGLHFIRGKAKLAGTLLGLAGISALAMAFIYEPGNDPSRVYYGTDTRMFSLLIGAALAVVWPSRKLKRNVSAKGRFRLDLVGVVSLLLIGFAIKYANDYDPFLYRGGFLLISVVTAIAIAVLAHPASRLSIVIGCKPLRWLGIRSYGLYLWHYPIIVFTTSGVSNGEGHVLRSIMQVIVSIIIAELSWRYIEDPIRQGALRKIGFWASRKGISRVALAMYTVGLLFLLVISYVSIFSTLPANKSATDVQMTSEVSSVQTDDSDIESKNIDKKGSDVTAIGDSVIMDAEPYLHKLLPGIVVEGKVGRQMSQAPSVINQLAEEGRLGSRIIIELGTNGAFTKQQLQTILDSLHGAEKIILVNTHVPKPWQRVVNDHLSDIASEYQNVTLIDWNSASMNQSEYFEKDGVHLKPEGAQAYAAILAQAILSSS